MISPASTPHRVLSGSAAGSDISRHGQHAGHQALARLRGATRAGLGSWPTPIERARCLSGRPLWIKRDDLSGLGRGGAKARKIDLVVGRLLADGHDELITVAGNVTNLAFDLVPVLARFGIRATLFIADDPPATPEAREWIFAGIRDAVRFIGGSPVEAACAAVRAWIAARAAGRCPLLLLPGASHPVGVLGNALGFVEMIEQFDARGEPPPSAVFVTAATGTTLAGFLLAEHVLRASGRPPVRVIAAETYGGATRSRTRALLRWTERALALSAHVPAARIEIDRGALAGGFGRYTREQTRLCDRVRDTLDLAIDPIFGGKTWSVLEARAGEVELPERPVLYWHCGFTPEWQVLGRAVQGA